MSTAPMKSVADSACTERLFSYGTLQQADVQQATFGRLLQGSNDVLPGFRQTLVKIEDAAVVATSGKTHHPMVQYTGQAHDGVPGTVFAITPEELQQADTYEVAAYRRQAVCLLSGLHAWVYVDAKDALPQP